MSQHDQTHLIQRYRNFNHPAGDPNYVELKHISITTEGSIGSHMFYVVKKGAVEIEMSEEMAKGLISMLARAGVK